MYKLLEFFDYNNIKLEVIIMSYWIHDAGNKNSSLYRYFMCDYLSDIKNLPTLSMEGQPQENDTVCKNKCCPGSRCLCLEDGSRWILGKDEDKWIKYKAISSDSEIIIGGDFSAISSSSIQSLFS